MGAGAQERELISFDYAVKYLLRDKSDFVILSGFLTELLGRKVEVQAIIESESNKADPVEKTNRVDLKAQIDGGELAVFEFQFHQEIDFFERVLYGVSQAVIEQAKSGNLYNIKKVYSINVAYYNLKAKRDYVFKGKFGGLTGIHFDDDTIPFGASNAAGGDIQPEYYLILPKMFDEELRGRFDQWVYILKHSAVPDNYTADGIEAAKVKLDLLRMSAADRRAYERYQENKSSLDCAIYTAELKGKEDGKLEGKLEVAKTMKASGMDVGLIVKMTGLSVDDIARLEA